MRQEQQMTRALLFITFTFLVLLLWQCVTQCFWMLGYGKKHRNLSVWNTVDRSFAVAKLGVVLNSSTNWIFYCFTCSMFRKMTRNLFGLSKKNQQHNVTSMDDVSSSAISTSNGGGGSSGDGDSGGNVARCTTTSNSSNLVITNTKVWRIIQIYKIMGVWFTGTIEYILILYIKSGFCLPSLNSAWDLAYSGRNCDLRETLRNLIDCWEDWELEKTDKSV